MTIRTESALVREELCSIMAEMGFPTLDEEQESIDRKWANMAVALAEQRRRWGPPQARQDTNARRGRCSYSIFIMNPPRAWADSGGVIGESALPWPYMARDEIADRTEARARAALDEALAIKQLFMGDAHGQG